MRVALVNSNRMKPPIAPIGLEYAAEALHAAGHRVSILDLCWADEWEPATADFFDAASYDLVGITLRNTDDCAFAGGQSFLGEFARIVGTVRQRTEAPIVLGGVGFSVMPEQVLARCDADFGIWADGEFPLADLAGRMESGRDWRDVPNLVWRADSGWRRNPSSRRPLSDLPPMTRRWFDNPRYFREGGQAGFETKRGCPGHCIYCADPIAKGNAIKVRLPTVVADELERLLAQGIDHLHTCDSEFNVPQSHAASVCDEMIRRGLGDRLRWYAYCSPGPFPPGFASLLRRAGCVGINFGVDSGDDRMLGRLGRGFTADDIHSTAQACRQAGIAVMLDLLFGSPGETRESIVHTIELMRQAEPDRVGVTVGVRVYPGTALADMVSQGDLRAGLVGGDDLSDPVFFLEPKVAPFVFDLLDELVGEDKRFFFFDPSRPDRNYNYNANERLCEAIGKGFRGAYWDILRRYE
jgi:radical SAM superfamily enzyme YgiQ (UPF0313 family)